jgi:lysozyme
MNIALLMEELTIDEGCKEEIYLCSEGHPTFGIGHLIVRGDPEFGKDLGTAVNFARIKEVFEQDVATCIADCTLIFKGWETYPEEAQRCFANMCFQLGRPRLSQFKKTIAFAEDGAWDSVATEILDSRWAKQTPNRAQRISDRFLKLSIPV